MNEELQDEQLPPSDPVPQEPEVLQEPDVPNIPQEPQSTLVGGRRFTLPQEPYEPRGGPQFTTQEQLDAETQQRSIRDTVHGAGSWFDQAFTAQNMVSDLADWALNDTPAADDSFKWSGESCGEAIKDVPEEYWHELRDAESKEEATFIKHDIIRRLDLVKGLGEYGTLGGVGQFGLALLDPAFIVAMAVTEGVAGLTVGAAILKSASAARVVARGAKLGLNGKAAYKVGATAVKTGARVGVGMGGVTALHAGISPIVDLDDVPTAMLQGAVFGMGIGAGGRGLSTIFKRYKMPKAHEPHLMTRKQFTDRNMTGDHAIIVENAMKKGNVPVPDYVLSEYPSLAAKYVGESKAKQLLSQRTLKDLGLFEYERPMGIREFLGEAKDPFSRPPAGIFESFKREAKVRESKATVQAADRKFAEAKKAYEDTVGEPWAKAEPFLERQRAAKVELDAARAEVKALETQIESLRSSVDVLVKDLVDNPAKYPELYKQSPEQLKGILDFLDFTYKSPRKGGRFGPKTLSTSRSRKSRVGRDRLTASLLRTEGKFNAKTLQKYKKVLSKHLSAEQNRILKDVLDFEAKRLALQEGTLRPKEQAYNESLAAARKTTQFGDRALDVARHRQSRLMMEVKAERDAAQKGVLEAVKEHAKFLDSPRAASEKAYWDSMEATLREEIRLGNPIPASALERFPELKKLKGVKTYEQAAAEGEPMVKDTETVSRETIADINSTIPNEATISMEAPSAVDPALKLLEEQLIGPKFDAQTVNSLKAALRDRGLRVSGNKQTLLDRLDAHDRASLYKDFRGMQKLMKGLKAQGFSPKNKGRKASDLQAQLEQYRTEVKTRKPSATQKDKPAKDGSKKETPELEPVSDAVALGRFHTEAPYSGMARWRVFFGGKFFSSFNAETGHSTTFAPIRWLNDNVLQDSIFKLDSITGKRVPTRMAGQTRAEMQTYAMFHEIGEAYQAGYTRWRQEQGISSTQRITGASEEAFGAKVADAVRGKKSSDPHVTSVSEAVRKTLKELDEHMLKEGLTEKLFDDPNYFPRKIIPSRVAKLIVTAESGGMDKFIAEAIRKGHEKEGIKLTPAEADALANVYLTNINTRHYAVDYQNNGFLGNNSATLLGDYLEKLGIDPKVRATILNKTKVSQTISSKGFQKHRLLLDETHVAEVMGKDGSSSTVKVTDLFDNNAKRVMSTHIRQVHGAIESHRIGLKFNEVRGISSAEQPNAATWQEMRQFVNRTAIKEGRPAPEIERMNDQMKRMQELVGGYSTEKPSGLGMMARIMQKFAGATFGSSFGMASVAEMGQPMAHSSIKAYLSHVGELPRMIGDMRAGKISGQLQKELAMMTGVGTEGRFFREVSTMLEHHPLGSGEAMSKVETVVGNLQNGAFKLGLLTSIDAIQRQYAGMLFAQEMLNSALKGKSSYSANRLAQIGLTEETAASIFKQMKLHSKYEGSGGNKLQTLNFKDWVGVEGREAAAAMQEAVALHTRKVIHQTHSGQLPRIMQNPIGRLLFQFRNFTIGSYETQLLSNLQAADARSLASFSTNTFFGMLSYLAIVNTKFAGQEEELEKYLTSKEIAKGAFFRSGYATHLPALIDTVFQFGGEEGAFGHGRSSGLSAGFLSFDSTPVGSLIDGVTGVGKGLVAPTFNPDYEYSEKDYSKLRKLIPYQNAIGIGYLHGKLAETFPEKSKDNGK